MCLLCVFIQISTDADSTVCNCLLAQNQHLWKKRLKIKTETLNRLENGKHGASSSTIYGNPYTQQALYKAKEKLYVSNMHSHEGPKSSKIFHIQLKQSYVS